MRALLEVENLRKYYPIFGGLFKKKVADVKAVDGINLTIFKGECFGLVGESGCGKTTFGKTVIRLLKPTDGHIYFDVPPDIREKMRELELDGSPTALRELERLRKEYDLATYKGKKLRKLRRKMQIVYQDPTTSLNPRMLVKDIVGEPLKVHKLTRGGEVIEKVVEMLQRVGLSEKHLYRYPHEFSGGQRQRIAIARALITNPDFIVLDEPTSAVDVSVRSQLLDLFISLQKEYGLTYLFISHDLSVIECISNRVGVMYLGKIVELAPTKELFDEPAHPYTKALISAIPVPDPNVKRKKILLSGDVPSPINPPKGCRFYPRCWKARDICRVEEPKLVRTKGNHFVACHFPED